MSVSNFSELHDHIGHKIECVSYYGNIETAVQNVSLECIDCGIVILDYDNPEREGINEGQARS